MQDLLGIAEEFRLQSDAKKPFPAIYLFLLKWHQRQKVPPPVPQVSPSHLEAPNGGTQDCAEKSSSGQRGPKGKPLD
jgi:hypothetical protein